MNGTEQPLGPENGEVAGSELSQQAEIGPTPVRESEALPTFGQRWATFGLMGKTGIWLVYASFGGPFLVGWLASRSSPNPLTDNAGDLSFIAYGLAVWFVAGSILGWVLWGFDKDTPIDALKLGRFRKMLVNLKGDADVSRAKGAPIRVPTDLSSWRPGRSCPWCPSGSIVEDASTYDRYAVISEEGWVVFHPEHTAQPIDADTYAICDTAGHIQAAVSRRGTLTRLVLGVPLPGSALLWAIAFPKATTHTFDLRESQFALISPEWSWSCPVPNDQVTSLQSAVALVAKLAAKAQPSQDAPPMDPSTGEPSDALETLERLARLHREGALTGDEYAEAKATQLRRISQ